VVVDECPELYRRQAALKKKFKKAFDTIVKSTINNDQQNYSEILTAFIDRLRGGKVES